MPPSPHLPVPLLRDRHGGHGGSDLVLAREQRALALREACYRELKALHWPALFPFGVDVALGYRELVALPDYLASEDYLKACRDRYADFAEVYRVEEWTLDGIHSGQLPDGTLMVDVWAGVAVSRYERWLRKRKDRAALGDREEILARFRAELITGLEAYRVGELRQGRFHPFGFDAFLNVAIYRRVRHALYAERLQERQHVPASEDLDAVEAPPAVDPDAEALTGQLRACLIGVARRMLKSPQELEIFFELVYRGGTTRSLAAQRDIATLCRDNVNMITRRLTFGRRKMQNRSKGAVAIVIGAKLAAILDQLPDTGFLFPNLARQTETVRSSRFRKRCDRLGFRSISLHSYRYAWARRAKAAGMPIRESMDHLGHDSKAVHLAYGGKEEAVTLPLEYYEELKAAKLIDMTKRFRAA